MSLSPTDTAALLERVAAIGTPEQVAARLQAYIDAGASHLLLRCCGPDDLPAQATRLMSEVAPLLRR
jgi:alkanesulfonate monooxygenase SsuD/methylene tetrahydromethanopterin reductase-like flavin-dependent oxidoreductase (luciferase family)